MSSITKDNQTILTSMLDMDGTTANKRGYNIPLIEGHKNQDVRNVTFVTSMSERDLLKQIRGIASEKIGQVGLEGPSRWQAIKDLKKDVNIDTHAIVTPMDLYIGEPGACWDRYFVPLLTEFEQLSVKDLNAFIAEIEARSEGVREGKAQKETNPKIQQLCQKYDRAIQEIEALRTEEKREQLHQEREEISQKVNGAGGKPIQISEKYQMCRLTMNKIISLNPIAHHTFLFADDSEKELQSAALIMTLNPDEIQKIVPAQSISFWKGEKQVPMAPCTPEQSRQVFSKDNVILVTQAVNMDRRDLDSVYTETIRYAQNAKKIQELQVRRAELDQTALEIGILLTQPNSHHTLEEVDGEIILKRTQNFAENTDEKNKLKSEIRKLFDQEYRTPSKAITDELQQLITPAQTDTGSGSISTLASKAKAAFANLGSWRSKK